MEEIARAAIADYKHAQETRLMTQHMLENENLNLEMIDNNQREGADGSPNKMGEQEGTD
jgi:hypothetical protein